MYQSTRLAVDFVALGKVGGLASQHQQLVEALVLPLRLVPRRLRLVDEGENEYLPW